MTVKIKEVKIVTYISASGIIDVYVYLHGKNIFERSYISLTDVSFSEILQELGIEL